MATRRSLLFSWDDVERLPELRRLEFVLDQLPDGELVSALEARRGRGRDEYPVSAMWRALVAGVVFGHESSASLLRELGRNPALLGACGFDPLGRQSRPGRTLARRPDGAMVAALEPSPRRDGVPTAWAFSRFLSGVVGLEEETGAVSGMVDALRGRLLEELPGYGRHLGYDGKAVPSRSTGRADAETGRTSDPDADWGKHETRGVDGNGGPWTRVKTWFGYGLHLVADVDHELPVWFEVERASRSEQKVLSAAVDGLFGSEPELASVCEDFCADRGLDGGPLKEKLWDVHGVRPLIDTREMWREEKAEPGHDPARPILRPLSADGGGNVLHTEKGEVLCRCPATGEERPMAFQGFEADRGALKYRCPAAAYGLDCEGRERCLRESGSKAGDWSGGARRPRGARPADVHADAVGKPVVAARLRAARRPGADQRAAGFGFERHFVRGRTKMKARLGLALAVTLALGSVAAGRPERMRSLVDPGLPLAA